MTTWSNWAVLALEFALFCLLGGFLALLCWIDELTVRVKKLEDRQDEEQG